MTGDDTPRERLARLEAKVEHLEQQLSKMDATLTEVHAVLLQAKGVRWFFIGAAAFAGFVASYMPKLTSFISGLPK